MSISEDAGPAVCEVLLGPAVARRARRRGEFAVRRADAAGLRAHRELRREAFVVGQQLFPRSDVDEVDDDPRTIVLVARDDGDGSVLGGVRLGPAVAGADIGWWRGGRLVTRPGGPPGVGAALVRAATAIAEGAGALRFDATVRPDVQGFFRRLGWQPVGPATVAGTPHVLMRAPIERIAGLVAATKRPLGGLLRELAGQVPAGFLGDDGVPVPGSDLVAACDAILPSIVERDPWWAGWCAVLVNVNDLAAMGAEPVGLLDALGAPDVGVAATVLAGLRAAASAYRIPVLGGHTQLGVAAALSVTALGRAAAPVPASGGRAGHRVRLTADLSGRWRPGYEGRQWDSTSGRRPEALRAMIASVGRGRPAAAKDVSMAGIAGTLGMLAEASGCGAVLDVADVPRPAGVSTGDWLTCFPGFAMLTTDRPGAPPLPAWPATGAGCGELVAGSGVRLRWPDGVCTPAVPGPVTGLGAAAGRPGDGTGREGTGTGRSGDGTGREGDGAGR
jgi:putative N-acetyltransferase (TIGR04045 family)